MSWSLQGMSWSLSALLLFLLPQQNPGARPEAPTRDLLRDLEPLTKWCAENRLPREHHRCCAILVHFVPDHGEARRVLQFTRAKDGTWTQSPKYVAPKTTQENLLPEFQRRFDALATAFRTKVLDEITRADAARRGRLLADLLVVLPNDDTGREATGETREGQRWVLRESVEGKKRALALRKTAADCVAAAAPPEKSEPTPDEAKWGMRWTTCLQGDSLRVLATVGAEEAVEAGRLAAAAAELFRSTFLVKTTLGRDFTLVQLEPGHKKPFIDSAKFPTKADREFAQSLESFWITHTLVVGTAADKADLRVEWAVRQTFCNVLRAEFGITVDQGALFEGVGLYLSWLVTGRRATFYVAPDRYGRTVRSGKLSDAKADWLEEAGKLMDKGPWLDGLLRKKLHSMRGEDLVLSFAFAAWLLEGHPDAAPRFLLAAVEGVPPEKLLPAHVRGDVPAVEARIRRWIIERKQLDPELPG